MAQKWGHSKFRDECGFSLLFYMELMRLVTCEHGEQWYSVNSCCKVKVTKILTKPMDRFAMILMMNMSYVVVLTGFWSRTQSSRCSMFSREQHRLQALKSWFQSRENMSQ